MRRQPIIVILLILAAFAAGYFVRGSIGFATHARESASGDYPSLNVPSTKARSIGKDEAARTPSRDRGSEPDIKLSSRQLEALLNMGMTDPVMVFEEMGLSETQIQLLQSEGLLSGMRESFRSMALQHATVQRDRNGTYIDVSRFPSQRLAMIDSFEDSVRKIIDDERTPIIAGALIARNGLLEAGLYRREIRISEGSDGSPQISERCFKEDGTCFREDTGGAFPPDFAGWKALLSQPPQQHDSPIESQ